MKKCLRYKPKDMKDKAFKILRKILPIIVPLLIIFFVIYYTKPPNTWKEASVFQILILFIPLLFTFTFFANLFLNYLPRSFVIGLGAMVFLGLQASNSLNPIAGILVIVITFLLAKSFKKQTTREPKFKNLGI